MLIRIKHHKKWAKNILTYGDIYVKLRKKFKCLSDNLTKPHECHFISFQWSVYVPHWTTSIIFVHGPRKLRYTIEILENSSFSSSFNKKTPHSHTFHKYYNNTLSLAWHVSKMQLYFYEKTVRLVGSYPMFISYFFFTVFY